MRRTHEQNENEDKSEREVFSVFTAAKATDPLPPRVPPRSLVEGLPWRVFRWEESVPLARLIEVDT